MTTSWSAVQLRKKTSLPICVRRGSQMWVIATHWAKVDLRRAVTSVEDYRQQLLAMAVLPECPTEA